MGAKKLLSKALRNPKGLRFEEVCRLAESFGFRRTRVSGSHHIYVHADASELVNLQNVGGQAKAYQVRQLLRLAERYDLKVGDEE